MFVGILLKILFISHTSFYHFYHKVFNTSYHPKIFIHTIPSHLQHHGAASIWGGLFEIKLLLWQGNCRHSIGNCIYISHLNKTPLYDKIIADDCRYVVSTLYWKFPSLSRNWIYNLHSISVISFQNIHIYLCTLRKLNISKVIANIISELHTVLLSNAMETIAFNRKYIVHHWG